MGGACGTYGGDGRCIQGVGGETRWKETNWKIREDNTKKDFQEVGRTWTGLIWLRRGEGAGCCECGSEHSA